MTESLFTFYFWINCEHFKLTNKNGSIVIVVAQNNKNDEAKIYTTVTHKHYKPNEHTKFRSQSH